MSLTTVIASKDPASNGQGYQPLLLASLEFADGSMLYLSTHPLNASEGGNQYNSINWLARIDSQDIAAIQSRSTQGIDRISDVTLHLFNGDGYLYDNWEIAAGKGFKGAILSLSLVLMDIDPTTGNFVFSTDATAPVKFRGICDAASCENGGQTLTVTATTSHNLARVVFPNVPCQQRCVNIFPINAARRLAGATDLTAQEYNCGYCPDQSATDPVTGLSSQRGNTTTPNATDSLGNIIADSSGNFISCNYTKTDCQARGMWDKDSSNRYTRRYSGVQWAPFGTIGNTYSHSVKYGSGSVAVFSARNDSVYQRNYPYVSGQQWLKQPLICNILGDANSTRMEVVIDCGDISTAIAVRADGASAPITNATNASPIVISVDFNNISTTTFPTGTTVSIMGVKGNTAANGIWTITNIDSLHFSLNGSTGNGTYQPNASVTMVLVNGVIVPHLGDTTTTTISHVGGTSITPITVTNNPASELFRWYLVANGSRTGNFTLDAGYNGAGDPYGSLAMLEVVVFSELVSGNGIPDVRVLMSGHKIKTPTTATPSDQPTWPYVPTTLPPWLVLDLLIEGNYTYSEIDLQSFIDAANFCGSSYGGNAVSYTALDGTTRTHNRFIAEVALTDKKSGQEVIQALLRSFNAQLIPNSDTGLLSLFIRRTLADQQPSAISGSNFNTPIKSIHADSSMGNGYVAYLIDESVVQQDGRGTPRIRGPYVNSTAQSPNRLTWPFQDADNVYQDDSISVVDPADVSRAGGYQAGGQQIPQTLPVLGITSFDQGIRIANVNLAENYRMNENQDSRGTRRWDIEATSRLEHLKVGQIVLLQYQAINSGGSPAGLAPKAPLSAIYGTSSTSVTVGTGAKTFTTSAGLPYTAGQLLRLTSTGSGAYMQGTVTSYTGTTLVMNIATDSGTGTHTDWQIESSIPGILARVEQIRPVTNYERATVTLVMHEDYVYTDAYGQHAAPPYSDPGALPVRLPYAWDPYGEQPQVQLIWDTTAWSFQAAPAYSLAADGSPLVSLVIGGDAPVNVFGTAQPPLFQTPQASQAPSGGSIVGGRKIYAAISAQDANGNWSPLSKICYADMVSGTANTFTTPTIYWDSNTVNWAIFAGISDQHWSEQLIGTGTSLSPSTPSTITLTSLNVSTFGAPDQMADSLAFQTKLIIHGGDWGDAVTSVTTNTLTFAGSAATTNQFAGQVLSVYALPAGSTGNVPIIDFYVVSNTATAFSVLPDPVGLGIAAGTVFVMRSKYSATSTVLTNPNFVNSYAPAGLIPGGEVGYFVRILAGTGVGQPVRQIVANTATTYTVDPPWDVVPDSSSIIIVEEAQWHPSQPAKQSTSQLNPAPSTVAKVEVSNYSQLSVLVEALVEDPQGNSSIERFSPLRELYIWGAQGTRTVTASTTQLATDGLVLCDATSANITYQCLSFAAVPNVTLTLRKIDASVHTIVINAASGELFSNGLGTIILLNQGDNVTVKFDGH